MPATTPSAYGDTALYSRRERDNAKRFRKSWRPVDPALIANQAALNWAISSASRPAPAFPILKGIATAEDAERAVNLGVDVVYVSNHGGGNSTSRAARPSAARDRRAVAGRPRSMSTAGSRAHRHHQGIALGADLVLVGRLYCYALAAAARPGWCACWRSWRGSDQSLGLLGVTGFGQVQRATWQRRRRWSCACPQRLPAAEPGQPLLSGQLPPAAGHRVLLGLPGRAGRTGAACAGARCSAGWRCNGRWRCCCCGAAGAPGHAVGQRGRRGAAPRHPGRHQLRLRLPRRPALPLRRDGAGRGFRARLPGLPWC